VVQDYDQAFFWYRKASDKGDMRAENRIAYCYQNGYGVEKDEDTAMKWYLKAAKQGDEDALLAVELQCQLQRKRSV
jgi:TPR repeat protein